MTRPLIDTNEAVTEVYRSDLGAALFNIYTRMRGHNYYFSARLFVVRRMIKAMLDAEAELAAADTATAEECVHEEGSDGDK